MFKKKREKVLEPEYYTSATNEPTINYKVYYMSKKEKILYFLAAFIVGAAVGYLFYGGIGKDSDGRATMLTYIMNTIFCGGTGILTGKLFLPIRTNQIIVKRKKILRHQFMDLLESLTTSVASGKNVPNAFESARKDLLLQYSEKDYIIRELDLIVSSIENGIPIEDLLKDFGMRSDIGDITNFGNVFEVVYRKGGNIKEILRECHEIIADKVEIEKEIETKVASNKNEQNIMCIMPIILIVMMKSLGGSFADNFVSPIGIVTTTIAVGIFIGSYFIGKKVLEIKI